MPKFADDSDEERGPEAKGGGEAKREAKAEAKREAKAEAKRAADPAELLRSVTDFLYDDDSFTQTLDKFIFANCGAFRGAARAGAAGADVEFELEHTALHQEFCALLDATLEAHLASLGATPTQLYEACRDDHGEGFYSGSVTAKILLAAAEFQSFVTIMVEAERDGNGLCNVPPLETEEGELVFS